MCGDRRYIKTALSAQVCYISKTAQKIRFTNFLKSVVWRLLNFYKANNYVTITNVNTPQMLLPKHNPDPLPESYH